MSMLVWRLFHNKLPTKVNSRKRGISLTITSSSLCVGGCGEAEPEGINQWCGMKLSGGAGSP
jgi:hypothetical protein